jgi:hypothetical protein
MTDTSEFSAPSIQSAALPLMAMPALDIREHAAEGKPRRTANGRRARKPSTVSVFTPASGVLTYFPAETD